MDASFVAAKSLASNPGPEYDQAHQVFAELLTTDLKPTEAANRISAIYSPLLREGKISGADSLWDSVASLAVHMGSDLAVSTKLAHFLNALSDQPDVISVADASEATSSFSQGGTYWADLPGFSAAFRKIGIEREALPVPNEKKAILNATTFGASYLSLGYQPNVPGMAQLAQISLKEALEFDRKERAAMYILPAATWMLLAGSRIRDLSLEGYSTKDKQTSTSSTAAGPWLWGKDSGFSKERWEFWKQRFSVVAEQHALADADIRDYAYRARAAMKRMDM